MEKLRGWFSKLAAIVAAFIRERTWTVVKFCFLFAAVTWFVSRNLDSLPIGIAVATLVTALAIAQWKIFEKASDAFFDVDEKDGAEDKGKKAAFTIFKRMFFTAQDYGLAALSVMLVLAMKKVGFSYLVTVFAVWILIDVPSSLTLVAIYEKTGRDMTLGRSYRRMANVVYSHSKIAGILIFVYEATLASFWSGPDYTVIFFRDELKTRKVMILILISITIVHAFLWTSVYWSGYDDVIGLVSRLAK